MLPASAVDSRLGHSSADPSLSSSLLGSSVPAMAPANIKTHYLQTWGVCVWGWLWSRCDCANGWIPKNNLSWSKVRQVGQELTLKSENLINKEVEYEFTSHFIIHSPATTAKTQWFNACRRVLLLGERPVCYKWGQVSVNKHSAHM